MTRETETRVAPRPRRRPPGPLAAALLAALAVAGCSEEPKGSVTGKVTYQSKPLPSGTVTFLFPGGQAVESTRIKPDGTFSLSGIPVGESKVAVQTPDPRRLPKALRTALEGKVSENATAAARRDAAVIVPSVPIPKKYGDPTTSGLTCEVGRGGNVHDIELTP